MEILKAIIAGFIALFVMLGAALHLIPSTPDLQATATTTQTMAATPEHTVATAPPKPTAPPTCDLVVTAGAQKQESKTNQTSGVITVTTSDPVMFAWSSTDSLTTVDYDGKAVSSKGFTTTRLPKVSDLQTTYFFWFANDLGKVSCSATIKVNASAAAQAIQDASLANVPVTYDANAHTLSITVPAAATSHLEQDDGTYGFSYKLVPTTGGASTGLDNVIWNVHAGSGNTFITNPFSLPSVSTGSYKIVVTLNQQYTIPHGFDIVHKPIGQGETSAFTL